MNFREEFDALVEKIISQVETNQLNGQQVLNVMQAIVKEETESKKEPILKLISGDQDIVIRACDGTRTIAKAKELFSGFLDNDFENEDWDLDKPATATLATKAKVYEMQRDADFSQMFYELNSDLDQLCLTQDQIIAFVEDFRNWLHPQGYATFFLFKLKDQYFVASVHFNGPTGLGANVRHFEFDNLWDADSRRRLGAPATARSLTP